jgi:anaerobic selenocysteine-containing dehydrogenase
MTDGALTMAVAISFVQNEILDKHFTAANCNAADRYKKKEHTVQHNNNKNEQEIENFLTYVFD